MQGLLKERYVPLWTNVNSYLKRSGLFRLPDMKRFHASYIDKNRYCQDGPLKSFSIFFLIYYKQIRFSGPMEGPVKCIKVLNFLSGPIPV